MLWVGNGPVVSCWFLLERHPRGCFVSEAERLSRSISCDLTGGQTSGKAGNVPCGTLAPGFLRVHGDVVAEIKFIIWEQWTP